MANHNRHHWLIAAALLIAYLTPAHAWNSTGHMTIAEIAYDNLTPKTRASVSLLLTHQRDYALWMSEMPAGETNRGRFAFLKAATWPDEIRKTPEDRPIWHYIDIPVIAPGYTPDPIVLVPIQPNAETQITAEAALMTASSETAEIRATALCWVEHLVGDIHQPLHDSSLFSPLFPRGDKGGNAELLTPESYASDPREASAHPHTLHALWDDALGNTSDLKEIQKLANGLETPAYRRAAFPQLRSHPRAHDWALEGNLLAKKVAYWNFALTMSPATAGKADVLLPDGYLAQLHKTSNQQIALAGLRLADLLNGSRFPAPYHLVKTVPLPGDGGWDYLAVDSPARRLYISRGTHVMVVDIDTGAVVGDIPGTSGVHGVALDPKKGHGFTSNGRDNTVTMFDLTTLKPLKVIPVGDGPDAIVFDPVTRRVFTFNARGRSSTVIDADAGRGVGTITLPGRPEFAVADGSGHLYDNIEDKGEIAEINTRTLTVEHVWPTTPGESPSGLTIDPVSRRLFSVCDNQKLVVMDADTGKVVSTPGIGNGPDACKFDPATHLVFSPNGQDGTVTILKEQSSDRCTLEQTLTTQRGARTMALDEKTHRILTVAATARPAVPGEDPRRRTYVPGTFVLREYGN